MAATTDRKEYHRQWYLKNREKRLAQTKAYQSAHKEKYRLLSSAYRKSHPDVFQNAQSKYRAKNLEICRARWRAWYYENRERELARSKEKRKLYYPANKDKILEHNRAYHAQNSEKIKTQQRQYREKRKDYRRSVNKRWRTSSSGKAKLRAYAEANRGRIVAYTQKRQALKVTAAKNLDQIQRWMESVRKKPAANCYYCNQRIPSNRVHFDHIIALSKGGPHCVSNLCVSCDSCNLSKGAKPIRAWIQTGQGLLEL